MKFPPQNLHTQNSYNLGVLYFRFHKAGLGVLNLYQEHLNESSL